MSDAAYISAKKTVGPARDDTVAQFEMRTLRAYRLARLQAELRERDYGAAVLYDPINVRYATGARNMSVWVAHNATRYCVVPAEGKAVLFEFASRGSLLLPAGLETLAEVLVAKAWTYFAAGHLAAERVEAWADEIDDLLRELAPGNVRVAFDHLDPMGLAAMEARGFQVFDGQEPCERARAIKSAEEIACMAHAVAVCDAGMARMREHLRPGITENELWAHLHYENIRLGGEWIETRLLASGGRTNPWFQEASDRVIRPGDLVSFDTDLIGPYGYCADISRTFICGPGRPSDEQRTLYGLALEQIHHNTALLRPGLSFQELREKAWRIPTRYEANKYSSLVHGVGFADEWPAIGHIGGFKAPIDGTFEAGMTVCVEAYIGEEDGAEGVKLEEQVLITDNGCQILSTFPFEEALLG